MSESPIKPKEQKKRLSNQQRNRIAKNQTESADGSLKAMVVAQMKHGVILNIDGTNHAAKCRSNLTEIVVGDWVIYKNGVHNKIVLSNLPRKNIFSGLARSNRIKTFAANIDTLLLVIAPKPKPNLGLIDTVMLNCIINNTKPVVVCNKSDLLDGKQNESIKTEFLALIDIYKKLDIQACFTSAEKDDIANLLPHITNSKCLLFGQSGTGKSSILNRLIPTAAAQVNAISNITELGKHTTSVAKAYLQPPYNIIDCPGIRILSVSGFTKADLAKAYPDIHQYSLKCRYRNCSHSSKEKDCALHQATTTSQTIGWRVKNYLGFIGSI